MIAICTGAAVSLLDPQKQTSGPDQGNEIPRPDWPPDEWTLEPPSPAETSFRHSGWQPLRRRIFAAMKATGARGITLANFYACGSGAWVQVKNDGSDVRVVSNQCHHRWCVPCQHARGSRIRAAVVELSAGKGTHFVTLTLRHNATPLSDQIDRLWRSFRALRHKPAWKDAVPAGVAFLEVKRAKDGAAWHPHLHIICTGRPPTTYALGQLWHAITGDSFIVDVRKVDDVASIGAYCVKYATKPAGADVARNLDWLIDAMVAMKGRRYVTTFGTWRNHPLFKKADDDAAGAWRAVDRLDRLIAAAPTDPTAAKWLEAIRRKYPGQLGSTPANVLENCDPAP